MGWVTEPLIGTKDDNNKSFTISATPVLPTMAVFQRHIRLVRVTSIPSGGAEGFQGDAFQTDAFQAGSGSGLTGSKYFIASGTSIELGRAPASGDSLVARYLTDEGEEGFGGGGFGEEDFGE